MVLAAFHVSEIEQAFWDDACLAARLFGRLYYEGHNGSSSRSFPSILVHAKAGPVLDAWMEKLHSYAPVSAVMRRVPQSVTVSELIGGLDVSATVDAQRTVFSPGILQQANNGILVLPMADTMEVAALSAINSVVDSGSVHVERDGLSRNDQTGFGLIVVDQSEDDDEGVSAALSDRCMMHVDLSMVSVRALDLTPSLSVVPDNGLAACDDDTRKQICEMALGFGLTSLRPVQQCLIVAGAHARESGRKVIAQEDVAAAMRLSLIHRAKHIPSPPQSGDEENSTQETPQQDASESQGENAGGAQGLVEDSVADAVATALPDGLLDALMQPVLMRQSSGSGRRGIKQDNFKRGRPLASRSGKPGGNRRLDLMATLRKAAPWQKVRRHQLLEKRGLHIRSSDFQIRRFKQSAETTTIFVVDASGSTALNRLGEAKGAIELLLSESYARRDNVALVSFRGTGADLLLPPTRALARAKKALAALPGGGGTPLAAGLQTALMLALDEQNKGRQCNVVVLTDGSANVGLNGKGGRPQAVADAVGIAHGYRASGISAMVVDVGRKPGRNSSAISQAMGAELIAMPFATAQSLSGVVQAARS